MFENIMIQKKETKRTHFHESDDDLFDDDDKSKDSEKEISENISYLVNNQSSIFNPVKQSNKHSSNSEIMIPDYKGNSFKFSPHSSGKYTKKRDF